jgi:hypothetical protein
MPIAECGVRKKNKKIRNSQSEITGPMLFPCNPANGWTSGPQAWLFAEKAITKVGKRIFSLDGDFLGRINLVLSEMQ